MNEEEARDRIHRGLTNIVSQSWKKGTKKKPGHWEWWIYEIDGELWKWDGVNIARQDSAPQRGVREAGGPSHVPRE